MPRIDELTVQRILDTAKIEEVVGEFVTLKKKGLRYLGLCPFHNDRHLGSFVVYPKGNCFKCFVCDAKGGAVDFLMKHERLSYPDALRWLGKKYNIETDMTDFNYTPPPPRPTPPPLELLILPKRLMTRPRNNRELSTLVQWIRTGIQWDTLQRKRIEEVLEDYNIGCSKQGMTIFWQIDEQDRLRTGKMMRYRADGHRDKEARYSFDWIHSSLARHFDASGNQLDSAPWPHPELYDPDRQEMQSCYFGMHLLNRWKRKDIDQTVCIVESEKTAVLMAIAYGNNAKQVWMACGGLENLNHDKLRPVIEQRRPVILYPDRDGISKWQAKAQQIGYDRLMVDTHPVTDWWRPEDGEKADIADVVIRTINQSRPITTIEEVKATMPAASLLIEKLNLTIANNNEQPTETSTGGRTCDP